MKLELKHLAPYLPYGLQIINKNDLSLKYTLISNKIICVGGINEIGIDLVVSRQKEFKPILRPLSDLTKEVLKELRNIENNDYLLWAADKCEENFIRSYEQDLNYSVLDFLYENHFDVFQLIPNNLAININNLKDENN